MGLSSAMKQRNDALGAGAGGAPAGGYASPTGPPPGAQGGFASPTGPPPNFASPGGPPPGHYQAGAFASPTGPPPNFMSPTGPPPGHQAGSTEPSVAQITAILKHTVADVRIPRQVLVLTTKQGIQAFYPATQQGRLEGIANQIIQTRAVSLLAARWRISTEKAIEFVSLSRSRADGRPSWRCSTLCSSWMTRGRCAGTRTARVSMTSRCTYAS